MAQTLGERLVDEDGNQSVLDQVGALLRTLNPDQRDQIDDRDAERPISPRSGRLFTHRQTMTYQEQDEADGDPQLIVLVQRLGQCLCRPQRK